VVLVLFHSILAFAIAVLTVIKLGESITDIFFLVLVDAFSGVQGWGILWSKHTAFRSNKGIFKFLGTEKSNSS
jgi:hypothetical protein